jgi:hypothetical protein
LDSRENLAHSFLSFSLAFSSNFISKFLISDCRYCLSLNNKLFSVVKSDINAVADFSLFCNTSSALLCCCKVVRRSPFFIEVEVSNDGVRIRGSMEEGNMLASKQGAKRGNMKIRISSR